MDKDLVITVNIGSRPYKLRIDRDDEERTRKAVETVEASVSEYAKVYAYKDKQDLLAMAALDQALNAQKVNDDSDYVKTELETKLKEIDELLSEATPVDH